MWQRATTGASGGGGKLVTYASATSDGGYNYNLTKDGQVLLAKIYYSSVQHYEDENIIFDTSLVSGQCQRKFTNKKNGVFFVQDGGSIIVVNDTQESHYNTPNQYFNTVYQVIAE